MGSCGADRSNRRGRRLSNGKVESGGSSGRRRVNDVNWENTHAPHGKTWYGELRGANKVGAIVAAASANDVQSCPLCKPRAVNGEVGGNTRRDTGWIHRSDVGNDRRLGDNKGLRRGRATPRSWIAHSDLDSASCGDVSGRDCGREILRAVNGGSFSDAAEVEDGAGREVCAGCVDGEGQRAGNDSCGVNGNEVGNWIGAKVDDEVHEIGRSYGWQWI